MADIDFDTLSNTNTVTDITSVNFNISADTFTNSNTITDADITLIISANTLSNTNIITNISSVDFTILPNSLANLNIVRNVILSEPPIILEFTTFVNSNTVTDIDDVIFTHVINANSITSTNIVGSAIIGDDKEFDIGTINNAISNIVSQCAITQENVTILGVYNQRAYTNRPKLSNYTFCDISMDFVPHPLTGDIANLYDTDAINQSLNNLILTNRHEHPFEDYIISSRIRSLLFELYDNGLDIEIKQEIFSTIINFEPRIYVDDIKIEATPTQNSIRVAISYHIKTFDKIEKFVINLDRA